MLHYTYAHYKPNGEIFYIGKGHGHRAYSKSSRNPHWKHIVNKHGNPTVQILAYWNEAQEALSHEILLIECFRSMGKKLANITNGGEGTIGFSKPAWNKGIPMSDAQKLKCSIARTGKPSPRKGVTLTDEVKRRMGEPKKGRKTPEHVKQLIREKVMGFKHPTVECPHCHKVGGLTAMPRWHFDNCRNKEST